MNREQALQAARMIIQDQRAQEAPRLDRIAHALKPAHMRDPSVELPKEAIPVMRNLARKSQTNLLPLVLDTFAQVLQADGYTTTTDGVARNAAPWAKYWQPNGLDARQTGVYRSAMQNGAAYVTVLPGRPGPVIRGVSARQMTALYGDPVEDEWPMMALRVDGQMVRLYDEENVYFFGVENQPRSGLGASAPLFTGRLDYIETRAHGVGHCPVVRFRDRMLLEGEEQFGIIEPLMSIQQRIDETTFGLMIAQFFSAFKQRYIIGWVPKSERETLEASASSIWTFDDPEVKIGELSETDLTRYLTSKDSAIGDMAAIAQVPAQSLGTQGISNVSGDVLAALQDGKDRKADEMRTSFGESWEQALRAAAAIDGDAESASDFSAEIRWKNTSARSLGQTIDALVKMVTSLGVPEDVARAWIPGWTQQMEADTGRGVQAASPDAEVSFEDLMASFERQGRGAA